MDESASHRLKAILWRDLETKIEKPVWIVTQNENGPCPLIAMINLLVLRGDIELKNEQQDTSKEIRTTELVGLLMDYLYSHEKEITQDTERMDKIIHRLPELSRGLDVNIHFDSIRGIEANSEAELIFKAFEVDFVHGWVVNPISESEIFNILTQKCGTSYEGAVSYVFYGESVGDRTTSSVQGECGKQNEEEHQEIMQGATLIREFLNSNATQITDYGLQIMQESIPENHLSLFFRNNHFSTLYKRRDNELYLLCTDVSLASDSRIVWETLSDVNQLHSEFLDSNFIPMLEEGGTVSSVDKNKRTNDNDYVRNDFEEQKKWFNKHSSDKQHQINSDYQYALSLQKQAENPSRTHPELPPGMNAGKSGLYGVPQSSDSSEGARHNSQRKKNGNANSSSGGFRSGNPSRKPERKQSSPSNCILF